ncbi:MAG TPA: choice-of-anchor D domain-containing protein, partial [Acidimicrobiales bacterium]|nr:choice-of-anchor D domain-containing protein [Acidimicrobiales bacterium]
LAFGSTCDYEPYEGYVVGVNAASGARTAMWSDEVGSLTNEAGIWQSGGGLVSDGPGRILLTTGNGASPPPGPGDSPPSVLGDSVVRLGVNPDGTLSPQSFFSPANTLTLAQNDTDLGSGGPMELPPAFGTSAHPHLVMQAGKDGRVFLLDADHLGGEAQGPNGSDKVVGVTGPYAGVWGHPAFWGGDGGFAYSVENGGPLRAFRYGLNGSGTPTLTSAGASAGTFPFGSGSPVVTSTGTTSGSALVWTVYSPGPGRTGAQLRAYNAIPQNGTLPLVYQAPIGTAAKFSVPATDGGRVFVGTGDGHVVGFGAPTTPVLQAPTTDFGLVGVGSTANATVTITANRPVTLSGITTSAPFGTSPPQLPLPLSAGQRLSVPTSFTPTAAGAATGTLNFATNQGTATVSLTGTGSRPGLGATPTSLSFTGVPTGTSKTLNVTITNTGTTTETITGVTPPGPPFTVSGLPSPGTTLQAQGSVSASVTYDPTAAGSDAGNLQVTSDAGGVSVPLTGSAVAGAPRLSIQPNPLDFGAVPVGESQTMYFKLTNTGNVPLTITKATTPTGAFTAPNPVADGQQVAPGATVYQAVTFAPTAAGTATAQFQVTGNDGQGTQTEQLTGSGTGDPVGAYYNQLGGAASYLGNPIDNVYSIGGGEAQDFQGGSIYWSPATAAHAVHGAILAHYQALGGPLSFLGFPITDETGTPDGVGRFNHFANDGSIYWTPGTGAWSIHGAIRDHWAAMGWERSALGYPTSDETGVSDGVGRYNTFAGGGGGAIYWTPRTGAWSVHGAILAHYQTLGGPTGVLGYPVTDETGTPDGVGRFNTFAGGGGASIYWTPGTGAWSIHGAIRDHWAAMG